jgi:Aerotolerance regulator N-terminal
MTWLAPGAFAALALVAGPVLVHLLARRNARRLIFPATHFVRATQSAAVRLRRPSDIGLLLLRLAIVATAVLAAAQPLVITRWRLARWNARVSRAVIVDASRGLAAPGMASRLGDQEMRDVFAVRRLNTSNLADGIERAGAWLERVPPSRREIVVISDFQLGALAERDLAPIPAAAGIRLIRAGIQPDTRRVTSAPIEGWRGGVWQATTTIDAAGTRASWTRTGSAAAPSWISVAATSADAGAADRALRAALSPGVAAGDNSHRVLVRFAGADPLAPPVQPVGSPWIAAAALALQHSDLLRGAEPVAVSERDGVMIVDTPVTGAGLAAPAVVRAALLAVRPETIVDPQTEIAALPDTELARWRRESAPVTRSAIPMADDSDGRWVWLFPLALLGLESRVRRVSRRRGQARSADGVVHVDAA